MLETYFQTVANIIELGVDALAILMVGFAAVDAAFRSLQNAFRPARALEVRAIWLNFAGWILLALEFSLGAEGGSRDRPDVGSLESSLVRLQRTNKLKIGLEDSKADASQDVDIHGSLVDHSIAGKARRQQRLQIDFCRQRKGPNMPRRRAAEVTVNKVAREHQP